MQDEPTGPTPTPGAPVNPSRPELSYAEFIARRRRRLAGKILLIVGAIALVVFLGGKPVYRAIKAWQARRLAREANALMVEEKWTEASRRVQDAYLLRPNEPEAVRASARLLTRVSRPGEAVPFWEELAKLTSLTREDRRDYFSCALAVGQLNVAEAQLAALAALPGGADSPTEWLLTAELAALRAETTKALEFARRVMGAGDRATPRERFIASLLASNLPDPAGRRDGAAQMTRLSEGDSPEALEALVWHARRRIAGNVDPEAPAAAELVARLNRHPIARTIHQLLALELEMRMDPGAHDEIINRAITRFGGATDRDTRARLVAWLNEQREPARALEIVSLDRSLESAEMFISRLDALGALGRWAEVKSAIDSKRFPLEPMLEEIYLARALGKLGDAQSSENHWRLARQAAAGNVERLGMIARFAEGTGSPTAAEAAYRDAVTAAPQLRPAHEALLRFLNDTGDTAKTHAQIRAMLAIWREDRGLQNDDAYFCALRNESIAEAAATAERLYREQPASLPHRMALALARLRLGQNTAALEVFRGISIPEGVAQPNTRVVLAAVLRANGFNLEARAEADRVPRARLKKEERELLDAAIK